MKFLRLIRSRPFSSWPQKPVMVTTPIFYVNAKPHLGHLYTVLLADAQVRYQKLLAKEAFLTTGTDEHGLKVATSASKMGLEPGDYCFQVSQGYRHLFESFNIDFADFVRTTEERHRHEVLKLWRKLADEGHIRRDRHSGWYSVQDENFLTEKQTLLRDSDGVRVSQESGHPVEWTEEENYVLKLEDFRADITKWLGDADVIQPTVFRKVLQWFLDGKDPWPDLSISRPRSRCSWGIEVPNDDTQIIYVWLDALANYLTVSKNESLWPSDIHVIGKDILKFHAIYWPAFLLGAGYALPKRIFVHSHWMVDNVKMSKSKGNVIDPTILAEKFTSEGLRYCLLREGVPHSDGNYNETKFINYLNAELANNVGNLLNRCTGNAINSSQIRPPVQQNYSSQLGDEILKNLEDLNEQVGKCYESFNFHQGVDLILTNLRLNNKFFDAEKPWQLKKTDTQRLQYVLSIALESLRISGILLQPIVPSLSSKLLDKLNVNSRLWSDARLHLKSGASPLSSDKVILFKQIK